MNKFNNYEQTSTGLDTTDAGLRSYMLRVYNYMGFGLILTAVTSYLVASSPYAMSLIQGTMLGIIVTFAPLAFILVLSFGINKLSASTAQLLFWLFAAVMGVSLSYIFLVYTGTSLVRVFLVTSVTFLAMSLYGYTTGRDLSKFGAILLMGLIGILIASIVNIFLQSSALNLWVSILGVLIFTGLTAWDTQRIKLGFSEHASDSDIKKMAVFGALSLYLNFLNLFLMLLRLIGDRR